MPVSLELDLVQALQAVTLLSLEVSQLDFKLKLAKLMQQDLELNLALPTLILEEHLKVMCKLAQLMYLVLAMKKLQDLVCSITD